MPKIEIYEKAFERYVGKKFDTDDELIKALEVAKAELDGKDEAEGILKIELNDTNRPDLWSTAGLGRQIRLSKGGNITEYPFFSSKTEQKECGERRVEVDPELKNSRPYIAAFVASGKPIDEAMLKDLIQTQEKLCWNYGQKRKSIAMGIYRNDLIRYPVQYKGVDPAVTSFVPLGMERELSMEKIMEEHPKGRDFGYIVKEYDSAPLITDANGDVLSFPPIINSARIGAVEVGDEELFIELTGTDLHSLLLTASIVACDLADGGHSIEPVRVDYPYDTPEGDSIVCPYYFQEGQSIRLSEASRLLGTDLKMEETVESIRRMGAETRVEGETIKVRSPEYRNDYLHGVDIAEDIMCGMGMSAFSPANPSDFTVGRLSAVELFSRDVKNIMIGLGYQEMIFSYLGSRDDFIEKMRISGDELVQIANPMTESYEYVRNSILPMLLESEGISGNAVYPHRIFEIGKTIVIDQNENYGTRTDNSLGFLSAARDADFNLVNSHISAILFYLSKEYSLEEVEDRRYIPGRCARLLYKGKAAGIFGEVHPEVLLNWGISIPCVAAELCLDTLMVK